MKNKRIFTGIASGLALFLGTMTIIAGSKVLFAGMDPGYKYNNILLVYNVVFGIISVGTAILIFIRHKLAFLFSLLITIAHSIVFILIVTVFSEYIATQSIGAMMSRSMIWLIVLFLVWRNKTDN